MPEVRATAPGFFGLRLRNEDDVFDVPEELLSANWMVRTDGVEIPVRGPNFEHAAARPGVVEAPGVKVVQERKPRKPREPKQDEQPKGTGDQSVI